MSNLKESDYLPLGATNDQKAPYNEPLNENYTRFVSVTISYYADLSLPPKMSEYDVIQAFRKEVEEGNIPKEFDIDEIVVIKE